MEVVFLAKGFVFGPFGRFWRFGCSVLVFGFGGGFLRLVFGCFLLKDWDVFFFCDIFC